MMVSRNAKILIYVSVLFTSLAQGNSWVAPKLNCGVYEGQGRLKRNSTGDYVLQLRGGSSSPVEVLLLGGKIREKNRKLNQQVRTLFYIPKPFETPQKPFVFLQSFLPTQEDFPKQGWRQTQTAACDDMTRFKQ